MRAKLHVVHEWETPTSVKDIRSFLGFANYYCRFVSSYARIVAPLTMLTKKDVLWHGVPVQHRIFKDLKSALCAAPLLSYPYLSLPYIVVLDTFADADIGLLMQDQGEGLR